MPDLWSKLGLSHSNTISCTETSHQLGKFHIMNHVGMHCTLNNNKLKKIVEIIIPRARVAIQNVNTDVYNSELWEHGLFHTTKEHIPPVKRSYESHSLQHRVPHEIKHSREENNPGIITTFPFFPLFNCQIPLHFLFIFLICFALN